MCHSAIGQIFSCPIFKVPGIFANVNLAQFFSHFLAANAITEILYYIKPPSKISPPPPECVPCTYWVAHKGSPSPPPPLLLALADLKNFMIDYNRTTH